MSEFEVDKTTNFRFQYNKLSLKYKRFVDEAIKIIKESPTDFQGKITHLAAKKTHHLYRFRLPGAYILYLVPKQGLKEKNNQIILFTVKTLY